MSSTAGSVSWAVLVRWRKRGWHSRGRATETSHADALPIRVAATGQIRQPLPSGEAKMAKACSADVCRPRLAQDVKGGAYSRAGSNRTRR